MGLLIALRRDFKAIRVVGILFACTLVASHAEAQTSFSIHDIMVASAYNGQTTNFLPDSKYLYSHYGAAVSVSGIVVGVVSSGDYTGTVYISEPSTSWDSAVQTAEGMPVFGVAGLNAKPAPRRRCL